MVCAANGPISHLEALKGTLPAGPSADADRRTRSNGGGLSSRRCAAPGRHRLSFPASGWRSEKVADGSPFDRLDFVYMPSSDIARDAVFSRDVLGGELVFAIEAMGARVAEVRLAGIGPRLLLADHLEGEAPILVFRVGDLDAAVAWLRDRGAEIESRFGIPHGPCATLRTPGPQRLAIYELTRPEADQHLAGRFDFGVEPNEREE